MAKVKPTRAVPTNRAAQQAKLRKAKTGKRAGLKFKLTTQKQKGGVLQVKIGDKLYNVFETQPAAELALLSDNTEDSLALFKNMMGKYSLIDKSGNKTPLNHTTESGNIVITNTNIYLNKLINKSGDEEKKLSVMERKKSLVYHKTTCEIFEYNYEPYCLYKDKNEAMKAITYKSVQPLGKQGILIYKDGDNYNYIKGQEQTSLPKSLPLEEFKTHLAKDHNIHIDNPSGREKNPFFTQHKQAPSPKAPSPKAPSPKAPSPKAPSNNKKPSTLLLQTFQDSESSESESSESETEPQPEPEPEPEPEPKTKKELSKIEKLQQKLQQLQTEREKIAIQIKLIEDEKTELKKAQEEYEELEKTEKTKSEEYDSRFNTYNTELEKLSEEQKNLEKLQEEHAKLVEELTKKKETFEKQAQNSASSETKYAGLTAKLSELDEAIRKIELEIKSLQEPIYGNWPLTDNQIEAQNAKIYQFREADEVTEINEPYASIDTDYCNTQGITCSIAITETNKPKNRYSNTARDSLSFITILTDYCDKGQGITCSIAITETNKPKNRYSNILAYDHTRVKLPKARYRESDYINANYVSLGDRHYIATQGPTNSTIHDFWDMIMHEKPNVICMVTKFFEFKSIKDTEKCAYYFGEVADPRKVGYTPTQDLEWPTGGLYDITSTLIERTSSNIEERRIIITSRATRQTHILTHLWYTAWPDHGVPEKKEDLIELSKKLDEFMVKDFNDKDSEGKPAIKRENAPPPVVHCSAGVGRTGTIIAINHLLSLYPIQFDATIKGQNQTGVKNGNTTKLLKLMLDDLKYMRLQRTQMIQGAEQYKCVFETVKTFYENDNTRKNYCFEKRNQNNNCDEHKINKNAWSLYDDFNPNNVRIQQNYDAARRAQQAARTQAARKQAARERAARERADMEQAARTQAARERADMEQAARTQAAREQEARPIEIFDNEGRLLDPIGDPIYGTLENPSERYPVSGAAPVNPSFASAAAVPKPRQKIQTKYTKDEIYNKIKDNQQIVGKVLNMTKDSKNLFIIGIKNTDGTFTFYKIKIIKEGVLMAKFKVDDKIEPIPVVPNPKTNILKENQVLIELTQTGEYILRALNNQDLPITIPIPKTKDIFVFDASENIKGAYNFGDLTIIQKGGAKTLSRRNKHKVYKTIKGPISKNGTMKKKLMPVKLKRNMRMTMKTKP